MKENTFILLSCIDFLKIHIMSGPMQLKPMLFKSQQ